MRFMFGDGGEYLMVSDNKTLYSYFFDLNHVVSMVLKNVFGPT
jgi:outer membrane lipoprotein-sorting protein